MVLWPVLFVALLTAGPLWTLASGRLTLNGDWRTASHRSVGLAPDPATHPEAIVQVYASRAFGWRGAFAVHTWLAAKPPGADRYTRYEVIGWYAARAVGGFCLEHACPDAGGMARHREDSSETIRITTPKRSSPSCPANPRIPIRTSTLPRVAGSKQQYVVAHLGRESRMR